jgi:hypothetical protein
MSFKSNIFVLIVILLVSSCSSSTKLLEKGDYDAAIDKSIKKLMKSPDNQKEVAVLKKAWALANGYNLDAIEKLKLTGRPDIWGDVYLNYFALDNRQEKVRRLPDIVLQQIGFTKENYAGEQMAALKTAVAYNYENASALLETGNKSDAREAYNEFLFIQDNMPNYKDVVVKIEQAVNYGTNYVLLQIENQSDAVLPKNYEEQIRKMSLSDLNQLWVQFDSYARQDFAYDFYVDILLKEINVSPELVQQEKVVETIEVEDGWDYVLDGNGNVMKDSLGNDIKVTRYVTLKAYVTKTHMNKKAQVKGTLDYYENRTGQLIKTFPITTEFVFDYWYATFEGDERALTKDTRELLQNNPIPFPTDPEIVFDTSDELKRIAFNQIRNDKDLFLN